MQDLQHNIALVSNNPERLKQFYSLLKDPENWVLSFDFKKALQKGLIEDPFDFIIFDCVSDVNFNYQDLTPLRNQQSLKYTPILFILDQQQENLKRQVYQNPQNRIIIDPIDKFAFISLITSSLHSSRMERRLFMYMDFVEGEKKLISNMDDLLEIGRINQFKSESKIKDYIRFEFLKRLELTLAVETVLFAEFDENENLLNFIQYSESRKKVQKKNAIPIKNSIINKLLERNLPQIFDNSQLNDSFILQLEESIGSKIQGLLFVPVSIFHQAIGGIVLLNKIYRNEFSENDLAFTLLACQKISYRLENIRLESMKTAEDSGLENLLGKDNLILKEWKLYKQILGSVNFGAIVFDQDYQVYYSNEAAHEILHTNKKQRTEAHLSDYLDLDEFEELKKVVRLNRLPITRQELHLHKKNIPDYYIGYSIYPLDIPEEEDLSILIFSEISQTKRIQAEIIRMDRMASLGILSSGIAHEIRNPLAGIKAMAQSLEDELDSGSAQIEYVQRIVRQVNRLDELLRAFFSYAKPRRPDPTAIHIKKIVKEVLPLFDRKLRDENIIVQQTFSKNLSKVFVDSNQIEQVFINLLINSIDAIQSGGKIIFKAGNARHPQPLIDRRKRVPGLFSNRYVEISIRDNGIGIPEDVKESIFNPFYTTKANGTGLGLSIVYQIIKEHGGQIEVKSWPEEGTEFIILLPVFEDANSSDLIQ